MKNPYHKNKGKVYPTPSPSSSSSSSSSSPNRDALSVLKILPAAILALASVLSLEEQEVLAYMINWSKKAAIEEKKKGKKPNNNNNIVHNNTQKPPLFNCECFECYLSYWDRWDSSPNGELIHQAMEAFEEHLTINELTSKKSSSGSSSSGGRSSSSSSSGSSSRGKKKEKLGRRVLEKTSPEKAKKPSEKEPETLEDIVPEPESNVFPVIISTNSVDENKEYFEEGEVENENVAGKSPEPVTAVQGPSCFINHNKGLARKVLPDVLGLFNSRLWRLWSPNV